MSGKGPKALNITPDPSQGPKFMAVLLWCQKGTCECPGCVALREVADGMIKSQKLDLGGD